MKTLLLQIPVSQSHHSNYKPRFVAYYSKSLTLSWDAACLSGWLQLFSIPVTHIFCCCRKKLTNIDFYYKHIYFLSIGTSWNGISNKNEQIMCDWRFNCINTCRVESLNPYSELLSFIHSFIQYIVSVFCYTPGSILGTEESVEIKTDLKKKKTTNKNMKPLGTYVLND